MCGSSVRSELYGERKKNCTAATRKWCDGWWMGLKMGTGMSMWIWWCFKSVYHFTFNVPAHVMLLTWYFCVSLAFSPALSIFPLSKKCIILPFHLHLELKYELMKFSWDQIGKRYTSWPSVLTQFSHCSLHMYRNKDDNVTIDSRAS